MKNETCPKGFGLKVTKLRLKTPLKIKDNLIGSKAIAQQTPVQWCQGNRPSKAEELRGRI